MHSPPQPTRLTFFGVPFGLLGLAFGWLVASSLRPAPVTVGRLLASDATASR